MTLRRLPALFSVLILFSCLNISAQKAEESTNAKPKKFKLKKNIKAAKKMFATGNIYAATDLFLEILEHDPENISVKWHLAETYEVARDYKNAEKWFGEMTQLDRDNYPYTTARFRYAMMLKMNANYEKAETEFATFSKSYKGDGDREMKKWCKIEIEGCQLAKAITASPKNVEIENLGEAINSAYSDIAPLQWDEETFLFASLPSDTVLVSDDGKPNESHLVKLYQAEFSGGTLSAPKRFDQFDMEGFHIANGAFSPEKDRFYFTACAPDKKGTILCSIYESKRTDSNWTEPVKLPETINVPDFTSTHPTVASYDGKEVLYFASNKPGGKGGMDLWYSTISSKGAYRSPRSMGSKLNTNRNEAAPFYDQASGNLYFSSNGQVGIGGYDVYSSTGNKSRWSPPEHLGVPVNSSTDDMYYRPSTEDGMEGYLVSNRPGIISVRSETCCDDIFSFKFIDQVKVAVKGFVYLEGDSAKTPINQAAVGLNLRNNEKQDLLLRTDSTDEDQPFFFNLELDRVYKLIATRDGYLSNSVIFNTKRIEKSDTLEVDVYLKKLVKNKAYRLENIYYDFDKWDLRKQSEATLDTLYDILIQNPTIIIELSSHTDSRGSNTYNETLSQKRAESCVNYLISKGIDPSRMTARGYGENKPLDDCTKYDECPQVAQGDCPCHQLNRRTEFKITGQLDAPLNYEESDDSPVETDKARPQRRK